MIGHAGYRRTFIASVILPFIAVAGSAFHSLAQCEPKI